jgi:predicted ester cyclase
MSTEENMALVRRFFQARAKADLDAMEELMAPGFISHPLLQQPDRESYKRQVAEYVAAFSNVSLLIEDQVAAGDKVVSRFTGRGTHDQRELMGAAPTGREWISMAIVIHRIEGGKIAEEWGAGTGPSELMGERLEQERIASNGSSRWPEAFSKPRCLRRCLNWRAGRLVPSTNRPERSAETSTTSSS